RPSTPKASTRPSASSTSHKRAGPRRMGRKRCPPGRLRPISPSRRAGRAYPFWGSRKPPSERWPLGQGPGEMRPHQRQRGALSAAASAEGATLLSDRIRFVLLFVVVFACVAARAGGALGAAKHVSRATQTAREQ